MRNIRVVDANVILRFLLADEPAHFDQARAFMAQVKTGEAGAYITEGVLVECVYVLLKVYQVPRSELAEKLVGLLGYKGVVDENKKLLQESLRLFAAKNVDIVDAIVHVTATLRGWQPFSFNADLGKLSKR
jgi:predicted nucleic-acid-binding protein